jgi:hypothetical protein
MPFCSICNTNTTICPFGQDCHFQESGCRNGDCHCGPNLHRKRPFNSHSASGGGALVPGLNNRVYTRNTNSRSASGGGSGLKKFEKISRAEAIAIAKTKAIAIETSIAIGNAIGIHDLDASVGTFVNMEGGNEIYKIMYIRKDLTEPHLVEDGTALIIDLESNNKVGYNDRTLFFTKDVYHYGGTIGIRKPFENLQFKTVFGMTDTQFYPKKVVVRFNYGCCAPSRDK